MPFDALILVRYKQGQWIEKQVKSSMFPKKWDIKRVKEEIAMDYDAMIKEGFELKWQIININILIVRVDL